MSVKVSAHDIRRLRLAAQLIEPVGNADVAGTVRHMLAVQAQDVANSLWAVGLRSRAATRTSVLKALEVGEVVRTSPMRGTLHFVASEDLRWMLSLTADRMLKSVQTRMRTLELDQATLDRAEVVARAALAGGNTLSRDEFMRALESNGIGTDGQRGYHIIFYLTQLALVCWGPPRGTQQSLVLVDEWIAPVDLPGRETALANFALRYFSSHGPATERDFAWWAKLPLRDVRAAIGGLGSQLTTLSHDSTDYLISTHAFDAIGMSGRGSGLHVLPGFDEYLLGYQDRSEALEADYYGRIVPGNNGVFLPMIVERGRVVGTWRRTAKSRTSAIEPDHFAEPTPAALAKFWRAARHFARFTAG